MTAFPKYPKYKDSGVEWLGDVPEHWEVNALRACAALNVERNRPDLPVLSVYREYGVILKDSRDDNHNATSLDTSNYKVVHPGDLAVNKMKAWQGSLGVSQHHGIVSPAYITCKVNQSKVAGRYLHYLLRSKPLIGALDSISYGVRVGQWDMRFEDFKQVSLTYPPRAEQERIVAFLDEKTAEIDRLIAKKQRQIELLDEQKAILINRAVTRGLHPQAELQDSGIDWLGPIPRHWEIKKIKHLATVFRGKFTHRPRNDPRLYDGPFPFIQTGDVAGAEREITSYSQTLNTRGLRVSTLVPAETVALTIAANVGDVAILGFDACFPDSVVGFMPHQTVSKLYLYYVLRGLKSHFLGLAPKNTQHNLNVERVGGQPIPCPPIKEQEEITSYIESIMGAFTATMRGFESQIQTLQTLRSTLIAHAVTGKIAIPAATA